MSGSTATGIRLSKNLLAQIEEVAQARKRAKTTILREAVEAYLEDWADYQIAVDRFNDPTDPVLTVEEFYQRLGRKPPKS